MRTYVQHGQVVVGVSGTFEGFVRCKRHSPIILIRARLSRPLGMPPRSGRGKMVPACDATFHFRRPARRRHHTTILIHHSPLAINNCKTPRAPRVVYTSVVIRHMIQTNQIKLSLHLLICSFPIMPPFNLFATMNTPSVSK
jgi:hypothetical protein